MVLLVSVRFLLVLSSFFFVQIVCFFHLIMIMECNKDNIWWNLQVRYILFLTSLYRLPRLSFNHFAGLATKLELWISFLEYTITYFSSVIEKLAINAILDFRYFTRKVE